MNIKTTVYNVSSEMIIAGKKRAAMLGFKWSELFLLFVIEYIELIKRDNLTRPKLKVFTDYSSARVPIVAVDEARLINKALGMSLQQVFSNAISDGLELSDDTILSIHMGTPKNQTEIIQMKYVKIRERLSDVNRLAKEIDELMED